MRGKNMPKKKAPKGYHYMPNGKLMKGAAHKAKPKKKPKKKTKKKSGY